MRQIVLDTETTGLEPEDGHRIIEIGAVEVIGRRLTGRRFHKYVNPEREIDDGAAEVHGISQAFLADKPRFAEVAAELLEFVRDAELIIHNAPFDVAFLDHELSLSGASDVRIEALCSVTDSLALARHKHPGQKNSLDALCRRYGVDNSQRDLHGALLDAEILADVYLLMTGGQTALFDQEQHVGALEIEVSAPVLPAAIRGALEVVRATAAELAAHDRQLDALDETCGGACVWRQLEARREAGIAGGG